MPRPKGPFSVKQAAPRWWVLLALLLGLSVYLYVGRDVPSRTDRHVFEGQTMGTTYRVVLGQPQPAAVLSALQGLVDQRLARLNASMSTYDPTSELSRFNQHASTEPFEVSAELAQLVSRALEISRASDGAFDVTVGALVDAWGFGPGKRPERPLGEDELRDLMERVGHAKIRVRGRHLVKSHPGLRLDLSAIAKGYGVDELASLLEQRGHARYLVEIGGELRGRGHNVEGRPFRVGIEEPLVEGLAMHTRVELEGGLATSGNYRNQYHLDGQRFVHTIDPATGRPVRHGLLSASVLHASCAVADAWATALMAAGPARAWDLARAHGLEVLLLVAAEGGTVTERATAGFSARMLDVRGR